MSNQGGTNRTDQALYQWLRRLAWPIIIFSILTAALSVFYTVRHLTMRTSRSELVAGDQRLIKLSEEIDKEFGSRDNFVVVVENGQPGRATAFAEALARELRQYPKQIPEIFYRVDPKNLKQWALLYLDTAELGLLRTNLLERRREFTALAAEPRLAGFFQVVNEEITRTMIGELFTGYLEDKPDREKLPDLSLLNATLKQLYLQLQDGVPYQSPLKAILPGELSDLSQEGYFFTDNNKYLLFLVTSQEDGYSTSEESLRLLRGAVSRVKASFPGLQVGVTGPAALEDDEMSSAMADVNLASWISLVAQMLLIVLFFRSLKRTLVQGLVLVIGLCWTFGVATLVVGHLNLLSIVFAPLMLGITVDFGIHWYCRLEEETAGGKQCRAEDFHRTARGASPGILYAALAAVVSVLPLVFTGFKGLAELGLIITLGILLYIFASLVLLPALALVTEKCPPEPVEVEPPSRPEPFLSIHWRRPGVPMAIGLLVVAIGVVSLFHVPFDLNPLNLQNQATESVVYELKLIKDSRYSTSYGTIIACDLGDLPVKAEALKKLDTVSHVESILSFLPTHVEAKQEMLQDFTPIITGINFPGTVTHPSSPLELAGILGRVRFKLAQAAEAHWKPENKPTQEQLDEANSLLARLAPLLNSPTPGTAARLAVFEGQFFADLKEKWDLLQANVRAMGAPPGIADLPRDVRERFISPQGNYLIRVFPSQDIWNTAPLTKFVQDLRTIDPDVVGDPVLLYVFTLAFRDACLWAAGVALLGIALLLWFLLRSLKLTLLAMIPLWVGTALTLSLMWLLGIPFNQANVLFLPLILGEGIEYGIIILVRWQMEESARAITLPAGTAKGVLLAALTTAVGFGSLMISGHRGTFSLGLLSTVGSLSVLLAALSVLPALLRLLAGTQAESRTEPPPVGWKRWVEQLVKKGAP